MATSTGTRRLRLLLWIAAAVVALSVTAPGFAAATTSTPSSQLRTASADPGRNVTAVVDYAAICYSSRAAGASAACQKALLVDIDAGRAAEGIGPMVLPRGYSTMSPAVQVFVVTDLERVDRGLLPVAGISATLSARAATSAAAGVDPSIAAWQLGSLVGRSWTGIQATTSSALEADWLWLYTDGWGGATHTSNVDCTSAHSAGCWGHRANVLNTFAGSTVLVAGTAAVARAPFTSYSQLVLAGTGHLPALRYTWKQALAAGADHR